MKFRIVNNRHEITFEANSLESFIANGTSALRVFRVADGWRVHRSEIRKTVYQYNSARIHMWDDGHEAWCNLGSIARTESGHQCFVNSEIVIQNRSSDSYDQLFATDIPEFVERCPAIWGKVVDTHKWAGAMSAMMMDLGDKLNDSERQQ